jgi:hypothetical protein
LAAHCSARCQESCVIRFGSEGHERLNGERFKNSGAVADTTAITNTSSNISGGSVIYPTKPASVLSGS